MPTEKEITKLIPRIYKANHENLGLFFFVKGQLKVLPTLSLDAAINNYYRFIDITFEEWDILSARSTYNRMENDFYGKERKCYKKNEATPETIASIKA